MDYVEIASKGRDFGQIEGMGVFVAVMVICGLFFAYMFAEEIRGFFRWLTGRRR